MRLKERERRHAKSSGLPGEQELENGGEEEGGASSVCRGKTSGVLGSEQEREQYGSVEKGRGPGHPRGPFMRPSYLLPPQTHGWL